MPSFYYSSSLRINMFLQFLFPSSDCTSLWCTITTESIMDIHPNMNKNDFEIKYMIKWNKCLIYLKKLICILKAL